MRRRIFASTILVTLLAVVLFGVPLALAVRSRYLDQTELELERAADLAAATLPADFTQPGVELPSVESSLVLGVYDTSGQRVAGDGPITADPLVRRALTGTEASGSDRGNLVAAIPVAVDGRTVGALRAAEPASVTAAEFRSAWLVMAGLAALALALSALVARNLASRLAEPVSDLRDAAVRLGDGDFTSRAPSSGIAELDEVASALSTTAERLGELLEREQAFSAEASHQLRTPLTSLRLAIEQEADRPAADRGQLLESVIADLDRLEATVEHLLAIARGHPQDRGPLDIEALIDGAAARVERLLTADQRSFELGPIDQGPPAHASAAAIGQALAVLVDNAVAHGKGAVRLGTHRLPGALVISVSDDGPGVTDRVSVFAGRPTAPGRIGLAMARRLVEGEGGRLLLRAVGPQPVFEIVLPADPDFTPSSVAN